MTLSALDPAGQAALFTDARTANTFTSEPVTDAEFDAIWDLARWRPRRPTPSRCACSTCIPGRAVRGCSRT